MLHNVASERNVSALDRAHVLREFRDEKFTT